MSEEKTAKQAGIQIPKRFTVPQRIEHGIMAISFTVLGLTGLIQKYGLNLFSERVISMLGGIQMTRIIHRAAAIVFALLIVYHVIALGYKIFVRRLKMTMIPGLKDVMDGIHLIGYSLFLTKEPPEMPRYNFAEKLEYWALIWGGIIMIATGFMLWNPLIITRFLPGEFIPAAKAAHGGEAVLAVLAIIVWHFYNVHIKMFNKSMFTGKLTAHQMEEEHGAEWRGLTEGGAPPAPDPAAMRRRRLVFMPVASLFAVVGVWAVYWAATAEATAISTLPAAVKIEIYSRTVSSPKVPAKLVGVSAPLIPHLVAGQEQCDACHSKSGMKPLPANHDGRPLESCRICHKPGPVKASKAPASAEKAGKGAAKAIPHSIDQAPYKNCLACHGPGKMKPFPENHARINVGGCTICHRPGLPAKEKAQPSAGQKAGGPKAIPHPVDKAPYTNCVACHGIGKLKPFPENHVGFKVESCAACHRTNLPAKETAQPSAEPEQKKAEEKAGSPKAIPHPVDKAPYTNCVACHGIGKLKPFPENHVGFKVESCAACHR